MRAYLAFIKSLPVWLRVLTLLAIVWTVLRLLIQFATLFMPDMSEQVGVDLKEAYLVAARNFTAQENLYPASIEQMEGLYLYSPAFAMLFVPFTWLPVQVTILLYSLLIMAAYVFLFFRWRKIFRMIGLDKVADYMLVALPAWLVFSPFWDDFSYLNIYTFMALLGTLLIEGVLKENLLQSSICLTIILAAKPQWAFAAAIPLLLGHYRFFFKLLGITLLGYLLFTGIAMLASNPGYIANQYTDYVSFLSRLGNEHPWRTLADGFLGYNHSIVQLGIFLGGQEMAGAARVVKYILLVPLVLLVIWKFLHSRIHPADPDKTLALELAFALYLGAFLWLDILWEITLSLIIFLYLIATSRSKLEKSLLFVVFIPYAILDLWRTVCYLAGSPLIDDAYLAWDYSMYFPIILVVALVFYFIVLRRFLPATGRKRVSN